MKDSFIKAQTPIGDGKVLILPVYQLAYDPIAWSASEISGTSDCYTYALGLPQIGAGALGNILSGITPDGLARCDQNPDGIRKNLRYDGLNQLTVLPQDDSHVLAVFCGERAAKGRFDYHCYRRDDDGTWSHQYSAGGCRRPASPIRTDFNGAVIDDPLKANRGPYTDFVGFYAIPYEGIVLRPKLNL